MPGDGYFKALAELKGVYTKSEEQRLSVFSKEIAAAMTYKW